MKLISDLAYWQSLRRGFDPVLSVGLVPTMGALHQGHASLLQTAKQYSDVTVLSLFVNPTQFNDPADFQHYPRTQEADLAFAQQCGVDYVLMPSVAQLYPQHQHFAVSTQDPLSAILEGAVRPGHFSGVLTVVLKLLLLVKPTYAFFGKKDFQQWHLIDHMAAAFFLDTQIIGCPTVRDTDGVLPLSSRNKRLSEAGRDKARMAFQFMMQYKQNEEAIKQQLHQWDISFDYVTTFDGHLFAAIWIDGVRLIDHYALNP